MLIVTSMRSIVAWMLSLGLLTRQADDGAGIAGAGARRVKRGAESLGLIF